jgi:hypothetical protein
MNGENVLIYFTDKEIAESIMHEWVSVYESGDTQDMTRAEHVQCLIEWERRGGLTTEGIESATNYEYDKTQVALIRAELFKALAVWAGK